MTSKRPSELGRAFAQGQISAYFAYGSNMNPARVRERGLVFSSAQSAWIRGYGLRFNKVSAAHPGSGHANLVWAPDERIEGVLYQFVDTAPDSQIELMDPFEAAPWNYGRDALWVTLGKPTADQQAAVGACLIPAWTYFANPAVQQTGLQPSSSYLNHLLAGREYLTDAYYERLALTPTSRGQS